jgi:hypothetical protein
VDVTLFPTTYFFLIVSSFLDIYTTFFRFSRRPLFLRKRVDSIVLPIFPPQSGQRREAEKSFLPDSLRI